MNAKTQSVLAAAMTSLISFSPQTVFGQDSAGSYTLEPFVVTASGVAVDPLTAPASITVITAEQLEKGSMVDLTDALRDVPGVAVAGAADGENIFIRGLPSEYTLILVDGKRVATRESRTNASGGVDQFYIPPVSAIERIEVVRGPMSSLHGSDAMGGVINIITKRAAPVWSGSVTLESTFPDEKEDGAERQLSFYMNGPILTDSLALKVWGRSFNREASERDNGPNDRDLKDIHAGLSWTSPGDHYFSADIGKTETDTDPRLNTRMTGNLGYEGSIAGWQSSASLFHENAGRITDGSDRKPEIENTILDAKTSQATDLMGHHDFTLGTQLHYAELTDQNPGRADNSHQQFSNYQTALFAEDMWRLHPDVTMTFGARFTYDERFGEHVAPRVYGVWEMLDGFFLNGGVATGYRTPELREFVEDYFLTTNRGRGVIPGNPDLEPEESTSYELGVRFEDGGTRFTATAFQTDFKNKIETRDTGNTITIDGTNFDLFEYFNVGEAEVRGVEITAGAFVTSNVEIGGSFTYTESERLSDDELKGQPLARTPDYQASVRVDWWEPIEDLNLWAAAHYIGESVLINSSSRGNTVEQHAGYATGDIGANYAINDHFTVKGVVYNLLDKEIRDESHGTVQNGRTLWLAVTASY